MLLSACSASSREAAIPPEAMPVAADLLCDVLHTNPAMLHQLLLQWDAIWPSILQTLVERSQSVEASQTNIEALRSLLQMLEESPRGKQLMQAHGAQLREAASHFRAAAGQVASAATQASKLEAQVRYVTNQ